MTNSIRNFVWVGACMERATGDREQPILVHRFSKDRRLVAWNKKCEDTQHRWIVDKLVNEVITSCVQGLVVKFNQEAPIVDMKSTLMGELRSVERSTSVSAESPVGVSAANAMIEKSVWEMQNVMRSLDAYIEWVCGTASDPGNAFSTWTVEIVGHVVSRSPVRCST